MAHRFFGVNVGQDNTAVTDALTTQTKDFEVNIDLTKVGSFKEFYVLWMEVKSYAKRQKWPRPAA